MRVQIGEAVREEILVDVEVRPALYVQQCDGCGEHFRMKEFCNDQNLGQLSGTFSGIAVGRDGRRMGNIFISDVCSFACAHKVLTGGWKKIEEYKPFAEQDYELVRAELKITTMVVRGTKDLRKEWSKIDRSKKNIEP